jgi:adenylate kinase
MKLVFLGIQGSGKGTQAELFSKKYKIRHISVGEILREEIEKNSSLGKKAKKIINTGKFMPDEIVIGIVKKNVKNIKGFILDGFPRDLHQAEEIEKFVKIDYVIYIKLTDKEAKKRIETRLECEKCGAIYSEKFQAKKRCEKCKGKLVKRSDDNKKALQKRIGEFHKETEPLVDFYRKKNKLIEIDGNQSIDEVFDEILERLKNS